LTDRLLAASKAVLLTLRETGSAKRAAIDELDAAIAQAEGREIVKWWAVVARDGPHIRAQRPDGTFVGVAGASSFMGSFGGLFKHDLGKRIYYVGGHYQMENQEQLDRRLARA
jgi:hypothetical protein